MFRRAADAAAAATQVRELRSAAGRLHQGTVGPGAGRPRRAGRRGPRRRPCARRSHPGVDDRRGGDRERTTQHRAHLPGAASATACCCSPARASSAELIAELGRSKGTAERAPAAADRGARGHAAGNGWSRPTTQGEPAALGRIDERTAPVWIVPTLVWSAALRPLDRGQGRKPICQWTRAGGAKRTRWLDRRKQFIDRQTDGVVRRGRSAGRDRGARRSRPAAGRGEGAGRHRYLRCVRPSRRQPAPGAEAAGRGRVLAARGTPGRDAELRPSTAGTLKSEGTIAVGKRADLVLLDADPQPTSPMPAR